MEDKLLEIFADVNVINHYGLVIKHPTEKWVMAKDLSDEFKAINIEGGAVFHRPNGKTSIEQKGCQLVGSTPIVSVIITKGCILTELNKISSAIRIKSISFDTAKNIKYELKEDKILAGYECLMVEHEIRDTIYLDNKKPVEKVCLAAFVENSDLSYTATVASGGTLILPDTEYIFTVGGVTEAPIFLPTLKNEIINIVWQ